MPSITVPSPGITSPASTTTTSPGRSSVAGTSRPSRRRATVSVRIARSASAWALPRPSASASARLREDDGEPEPDRDREGEPGGLVAAAEGLAAEGLDSQPIVVITAPTSTTNITGLRIWMPRVELGRLASERRRARSGRVDASSGRPVASSSSAMLSSSTFTPGSPRTPSAPPVVLLVDELEHPSSGSPRTAATRLAWIRAFASEISGSTPEAEVVTASTGTSATRQPRVVAALAGDVGLGLVREEAAEGEAVRARGC